MTSFEASVEIAVPADRVWSVVTDWERQGEWMPLTAVTVTHDEPSGVGTRLVARSGLGRAGFDDPMRVEVWEPPHRAEVRHLGRVVTGRGVFVVDPLGAGRCRFTWREELDSTGRRRLLDTASAPAGRALLGLAVRRLAAYVDEQAS